MWFFNLHSRKERLPRTAFIPIAALEELLSVVREKIAIGLVTHQCGEIPRIRKQVRDWTDPVRQRLLVILAMLLRTDVILVKPGHHGGPGGRTHRRSREGRLETNAFRSQLVDVRRSEVEN